MPELSPKSWSRAEVRCLAGYRANERPISFFLEQREVDTRAVLESWREPRYLYFKVESTDGRLFALRYHEIEDYWEVKESVPRR